MKIVLLVGLCTYMLCGKCNSALLVFNICYNFHVCGFMLKMNYLLCMYVSTRKRTRIDGTVNCGKK